MADIDIGAISEALNNKVDLPSPIVPQDAVDYVIAMQRPTAANNYTWYRKYKSGWVEQGGRTTTFTNTANSTGEGKTITLPVVMLDSNYTVTTTRAGGGSGWSWREIIVDNKTTTGFTISEWTNSAASGTTCYAEWRISGMSA